MSYTTAGAILVLLPGLPQTTTAAGYSNTVAIIDSHIARADAVIDANLSKRYTVPFSTTPPIVRMISQDIAAYFSFRSLYTGDNTNRLDALADQLQFANDQLKMLASGEMDVLDTAGSAVTEANSGDRIYSTNENYHAFFTQDDSTSWKFDTDLISDLRDER